jgi:hypothetical protein
MIILKLKKQIPEQKFKPSGGKNEIIRRKSRHVKSRTGKQGSIRSGGGKRN